MNQENILEVRNISKSFGAVRALSNVSFTVGRNEIVGLVGDNGAGKSTIINLLMGVYQPDEGEIFFEGKRVTFASPRDTRATGIEPVYQSTAVVDLMNLWRNFYLGREVTRSVGPFRVLDKAEMKKKSIEMMWDIGVHVREADESVQYMSGGERQSLCIGRCMEFSGKMLLLDEPTAALSLKETDKVLKFAESVREKGLSEIIVDHNIYHIYPIVDKFVVMGKGHKITELRKADVSAEEVIATLMKL
jgi:simple sugar transport system ATP-binding protein